MQWSRNEFVGSTVFSFRGTCVPHECANAHSFTLNVLSGGYENCVQNNLGGNVMPKNLKQEIIYGIMMVFAMVYAMVCYNVTLNVGGMQNFVFAAALHELPIMCPVAFLFDFFVVGPIAKKITFRIFNPAEDKIIFVILMISVLSIWMMCPFMSLVATILFKDGLQPEFLSIWISTTIKNFPMAFFWQLFAAGPLVRFIFGKIFH